MLYIRQYLNLILSKLKKKNNKNKNMKETNNITGLNYYIKRL